MTKDSRNKTGAVIIVLVAVATVAKLVYIVTI
jgi:hypothetical protein